MLGTEMASENNPPTYTRLQLQYDQTGRTITLPKFSLLRTSVCERITNSSQAGTEEATAVVYMRPHKQS